MPDAMLYRTSRFSIFVSRAETRTSFRSSFRPTWTTSSSGISLGVRPTSSSAAYRSFRFTRTSWTSIADRPRLWMSSIPSRKVRPLQDKGIPDGPKRITCSPNGPGLPLYYYSGRPDIKMFAPRPPRRTRRSDPTARAPARTGSPSTANSVSRSATQMFMTVRPFGGVIGARFHGQDLQDEPYPPAHRLGTPGGVPRRRRRDLAGHRGPPGAFAAELVGGQP